MNTKTIFIIVLVALAIFLGYKMFSKKNVYVSSQDSVESTQELQNLNIEQPTVSMEDDTKAVYKNIVIAESSLNWTARKKILTSWIDRGNVSITSGSAVFKESNLVSGEALVDMNTIKAVSTGSGSNQDRLTNHVKSADFFDVAKYPTAKINISSVSGSTANGQITIKDVTKPISFPVAVSQNGDSYNVSGKLTINRADFGVKYGSTSFFKDLADNAIVDDIFTIDFKIVLK